MSVYLRTAGFLVAMLGCGVLPTAGQAVDMVGEVIRVRFEDGGLAEGVVRVWTPSSLTLTQADGPSMELDWSEVSEVLRYRTRGHAGSGLLIGALAGGAVAGTHAGVTWEPCTFLCFGPQDRGGTIALAAVIGAVAGGALGALVGAAVRTPSWEPVAIPVLSPNSATFLLGVRWPAPW